jgi:hypothetical protein
MSRATTLYNGTEEPLKEYFPTGGFTDEKSIIAGIDLIEARKTNDYLTDSAMARLTDEGMMKTCHYKRLQVSQLILNLIDRAVAIVGASTAIDTIRENCNGMMKVSLKALYHLQGPSNNAGEPSSSKLKRPKIVEVPKFDVNNKPGMQTFLNSMELVTKSYKFDSDKDLAQFYLNNLTEASKTLIFAIYPLNDKSFYESSAAVIGNERVRVLS